MELAHSVQLSDWPEVLWLDATVLWLGTTTAIRSLEVLMATIGRR